MFGSVARQLTEACSCPCHWSIASLITRCSRPDHAAIRCCFRSSTSSIDMEYMPEVRGYGTVDRYLRISVNFCGYRQIRSYRCHFRQSHGYRSDTDSESLTANMHDKLRRIALYHYADCRMQTALCSIQLFTLVARQSPLACSRSLVLATTVQPIGTVVQLQPKCRTGSVLACSSFWWSARQI